LANERVHTNAAGHVVLKLKTPRRDGTTHLVMSPLEFMQRLAALVLRPAALLQPIPSDECLERVEGCRPTRVGERPVPAGLPTFNKPRSTAPSWPNANGEGSLRETSSRSPRPDRPFSFSRPVTRDRPDRDRKGPGDIEGPFRGGHSGQIREGGSDACRKGCVDFTHSTCAVQRRRFPAGASPARQPLQPEATGAVMEVTKWLKRASSEGWPDQQETNLPGQKPEAP
jgi:hypothetical protein